MHCLCIRKTEVYLRCDYHFPSPISTCLCSGKQVLTLHLLISAQFHFWPWHNPWLSLSPVSPLFIFAGCWQSLEEWSQHECDIMVLGQQLWHAPPPAPGADLRRTGRLRANAAGVWLCAFDPPAGAHTCLPKILNSKLVTVISLKEMLTCFMTEVCRDGHSRMEVWAPIRRPSVCFVCAT